MGLELTPTTLVPVVPLRIQRRAGRRYSSRPVCGAAVDGIEEPFLPGGASAFSQSCDGWVRVTFPSTMLLIETYPARCARGHADRRSPVGFLSTANSPVGCDGVEVPVQGICTTELIAPSVKPSTPTCPRLFCTGDCIPALALSVHPDSADVRGRQAKFQGVVRPKSQE